VRELSLPTVIVQEGGYQTQVIGACLSETLAAFL